MDCNVDFKNINSLSVYQYYRSLISTDKEHSSTTVNLHDNVKYTYDPIITQTPQIGFRHSNNNTNVYLPQEKNWQGHLAHTNNPGHPIYQALSPPPVYAISESPRA